MLCDLHPFSFYNPCSPNDIAYTLNSSTFMKKIISRPGSGCDVNYGARTQENFLSDPFSDGQVKMTTPWYSLLYS